jgi:hypothetical protein
LGTSLHSKAPSCGLYQRISFLGATATPLSVHARRVSCYEQHKLHYRCSDFLPACLNEGQGPFFLALFTNVVEEEFSEVRQ